ncbi:alpha/beta hydrolase [Tianweitania sp. BSSL-BM11]|uniref:Alpha/beta hydrolase n=1 Tax=Tianweitania aestuarii TaxID=2814886 RepID=A0ABS5S089_9HYPH|nr:alpha/beta hydrolase [Tianweitania aestuarii]MBS9721967.1 alpha/beta hydrolase [Tianweitania aestuarii]
MTDYSQLIDAQTWAFIDQTNAYYPPDTVDYTVEQQRQIYDRMCRAFSAGYPTGVSASTDRIAASGPERQIPIRIYKRDEENTGVRVLYFHGGGFILGGLESHDDVCADICAATGYEVVSIDYRLAPEHLYPASHEDGYAAFECAVADDDRPILLCGDSAGGNIAAAVAGRFRHHPRAPIGQVLIYPGLGGDPTRGSYVTHADAPMLTTRDMAFYQTVRTGGADVSGDAAFAPLRDKDFSDLPPTVLITAQCDPLSSDGEAYRDKITAAGGKAMWREEAGLVHGYLRARNTVDRAKESFERIVTAIRVLGQKDWPLPFEG